MSKHTFIGLNDQQRQHLESLIHCGNAPARIQTRARILLLCDRSQDQKRTDAEIAAALLCSPATVRNVRHRFLAEGLDAALYDRPRPGATPKLTGDLEAQLTVLACSDPPEGQARWTLRLLADRMVELGFVESLSHVTVFERLKKTNSSPGR
jgi:transposase